MKVKNTLVFLTCILVFGAIAVATGLFVYWEGNSVILDDKVYDENGRTEPVESAANRFLKAVEKMEIETILEYTNPSVIAGLGGEEKTIELLTKELIQFRKRNVQFIKIDYDYDGVFRTETYYFGETESERFRGHLKAEWKSRSWYFFNDPRMGLIGSLGLDD